MIEVPSAALLADVLAREVDFFSIGTNDLIQYTLAADRNNENVAEPVQPGRPGRAAADPAWWSRRPARHRIEVNVCGEMSGEPIYAPLLVGLGLRQLSATPRKIPEIKRVIRQPDGAGGGAGGRARRCGWRPPARWRVTCANNYAVSSPRRPTEPDDGDPGGTEPRPRSVGPRAGRDDEDTPTSTAVPPPGLRAPAPSASVRPSRTRGGPTGGGEPWPPTPDRGHRLSDCQPRPGRPSRRTDGR